MAQTTVNVEVLQDLVKASPLFTGEQKQALLERYRQMSSKDQQEMYQWFLTEERERQKIDMHYMNQLSSMMESERKTKVLKREEAEVEILEQEIDNL